MQQKPSEEEIGRSEKPGLDQRSLILEKETAHQLFADAGSKLSDQGDNENSEKAERETVGRPLLGESGAEVKQKKPKQEMEQISGEDLLAGHGLSRHGQDETNVGDDQKESLKHQQDPTELQKGESNKEGDKTDEKEGVYEQGPSMIREEKEGGLNHNQQDSSILSTIEPEQV